MPGITAGYRTDLGVAAAILHHHTSHSRIAHADVAAFAKQEQGQTMKLRNCRQLRNDIVISGVNKIFRRAAYSQSGAARERNILLNSRLSMGSEGWEHMLPRSIRSAHNARTQSNRIRIEFCNFHRNGFIGAVSTNKDFELARPTKLIIFWFRAQD